MSLSPAALCQGAVLKARKEELLKAIAEKKAMLQRKEVAAQAAAASHNAKLFSVWPWAG